MTYSRHMTGECGIDEAHSDEDHFAKDQSYTLTVVQRGKPMVMRRMTFKRGDSYGLTFWQTTASGKSREYVFDGHEISSSVAE